MKEGAKKTRIVLVVLATVLAVMLLGCSGADQAVDETERISVEWDLPSAWASTNYVAECVKIFADEVYDRTDGQVKINIHYGGSLGYSGAEKLSVVRDGLVPIADMLKNAQSGEEAFFGITSLPFLAPGMVELRMLQFFSRPVEDKLLAEHNQKLLFQVPWPSRNVYTKQRIDTIEDLRGMRIRVVSREDSELLSLLGATPVQMPWGEVVTSLATGVIDGVATSSSSGVDGKFWEFTGYASRWNWHSSEDMITVNLDAWNDLPHHIQRIIEDTARELEPMFTKIALQDNDEAEEILIANGMEISDLNPELKEEFTERSKAIWDDFMRTVPESRQVIEDYLYVMGM